MLGTAVASMPTMHEEVHERAGQQRQKYQRAQDVGTVLGEQKRAADDEKSDEDKPGARSDEARARLILIVGMVMNRHEILLFDGGGSPTLPCSSVNTMVPRPTN
jgi:hypothetical protein